MFRKYRRQLSQIGWLRRTVQRTKRFYAGIRYRIPHVHATTIVHPKQIYLSPDLVTKEFSFIGPSSYIGPYVTIGRYVLIAPRVSIVGGDHDINQPGVPMIYAGRDAHVGKTVLEDDVWVGAGVVIMSGVRIGRGAVVAAGAVVTKDVEPYSIVAGVPAKKIRERFENAEHRDKHDAMLNGPPVSGAPSSLRF